MYLNEIDTRPIHWRLTNYIDPPPINHLIPSSNISNNKKIQSVYEEYATNKKEKQCSNNQIENKKNSDFLQRINPRLTSCECVTQSSLI